MLLATYYEFNKLCMSSINYEFSQYTVSPMRARGAIVLFDDAAPNALLSVEGKPFTLTAIYFASRCVVSSETLAGWLAKKAVC
tara:strand:+ start:424 stop:672 length:249 start_codon:yes stop_codon:yes gene_type:complete